MARHGIGDMWTGPWEPGAKRPQNQPGASAAHNRRRRPIRSGDMWASRARSVQADLWV